MKINPELHTDEDKKRIEEAFGKIQLRVNPRGWESVNLDIDADMFECVVVRFDGKRKIPLRLSVIQQVEIHTVDENQPQSEGKLWLHVSVAIKEGSVKGLLPSWSELVMAKALFIGEERPAYQIFPKRSEHFSMAEVLHLWSPLEHEPLPDLRYEGKL